MYLELLERVSPRVRKETVVREHIDPALKIALMLHYLGTDKNYHSLQWVFHVPHNTISRIVFDVCEAINDEYATKLIRTPTKPEEWMDIAHRFVVLHLLWFYCVTQYEWCLMSNCLVIYFFC